MSLSKILIADDINNARDKVSYKRSQLLRKLGSALAKKLKSEIDFLFVEDSNHTLSFKTVKIANELHEGYLSELNRICKLFKAPTSPHLKIGSAAQEIIKFINKRPSPELVLVGTEGKKNLKRLLIGSVAEEVLRYSKRPVMVLGPKAIASDFKLPNKIKILLATDLSDTSKPAEKYALDFSYKLKATVTIFYSEWEQLKTIQDGITMGSLPFYYFDESIVKIRENSVKQMRKVISKFKNKNIPCESKIADQPYYALDKLILKEVKEGGYSLVIMSTHSRNTLLKAFLGSSARRVILNSPVPVLIVHK